MLTLRFAIGGAGGEMVSPGDLRWRGEDVGDGDFGGCRLDEPLRWGSREACLPEE